MRTLWVGYRVTNVEGSLDFSITLGYRELGRVELDDDKRLAVLSFPDEPVATWN